MSSGERAPLLSGARTMLGSLPLFRVGAAFATAGIIAGAFGSHGIKSRTGITPDQVSAWGTASQYAMYNGLALMLLSMHPRFVAHRFAGPAIAVGGLIFSSSIFALVWNREKLRFLGPVTPLGGTIMIAGYFSLIF